jgi:hypothetical protein
MTAIQDIADSEIKDLLDRATQGEVFYGSASGVDLIMSDGTICPVKGPKKTWVVWQKRYSQDGSAADVYLAITGDGPTSRENAVLFSHARLLAEEVLRLREEIRRLSSTDKNIQND